MIRCSKKFWYGLVIIISCFNPSLAGDSIFNDLEHDKEFLDTPVTSVTRAADPVDVATVLVTIGMNNLLQIQLFCHTNPLNTRNVDDLPIFLPQKVDTYCYNSTVGAQLFWNKTNRMHFTKDSSAICSYLSIFGPNELELIQNSLDEIKKLFPTFSIDPINFLPLLQNITVEERKLGAMFHGETWYRNWNLSFLLPLYYNERNFFMTPAEEEALKKEVGPSSQESNMAFAEKHLISDMIGTGDLRIMVDYFLAGDGDDPTCLCLRPGLFTTFPTSHAFRKGLKGTFFPQNNCRPVFSFEELFSSFTDPDSEVTPSMLVERFSLQVLDHLSANLLAPEMGNNKHFTIGALLRSVTPLRVFVKRPWAHDIYFKSFLSLEYLFPRTEKRFFIESTDRPQFDALGLNRTREMILEQIGNDPAYAQAVVDLMDVEFVNLLYPFVFDARISPGVIFRWTSRAFYERPCWGFYVGSDMWVKGPDRIRCVQKPEITPPTIAIDKAQRPIAYQSKIVGSIFYTAKRACYDWIFGLNIDNTIMKSGIGDDYSVSLNVEVNF